MARFDWRVTVSDGRKETDTRYTFTDGRSRYDAEQEALDRFTYDDTDTEAARARIVRVEFRTNYQAPWRTAK